MSKLRPFCPNFGVSECGLALWVVKYYLLGYKPLNDGGVELALNILTIRSKYEA